LDAAVAEREVCGAPAQAPGFSNAPAGMKVDEARRNMRSLLLCATLVTLCACPGPARQGPPDSGPGNVDAGVDSGMPEDAGLDCTSASTGPDTPCGTLSWAESPTMTRPRNHHMSVLAEVDAGAFLYIMGGVNGRLVYDFVDRAKLSDDGAVGAIETLPQNLPSQVGGATAAMLHDLIVVAGGNEPYGITDHSSFARVNADGSLSAFSQNGGVGHPRMHPGSVVHGDFVYVMGGFRDPDVWDDVVKAQWYPNSTLSPWNAGGTLQGKRSHMAVTAVGDYVYLTGGLEQSADINPPELKSAFRGHFDADGNLGEWVAMPDLPTPLATHSSAFYGGYLYVMGGINDVPAQVKQVWRSAIGADHALGAWEEVASLPVARGHVHNLPIFKNHIYSIAGALDFSLNSTGAIQIGTFQTN
jgi:hypothetical protein